MHITRTVSVHTAFIEHINGTVCNIGLTQTIYFQDVTFIK